MKRKVYWILYSDNGPSQGYHYKRISGQILNNTSNLSTLFQITTFKAPFSIFNNLAAGTEIDFGKYLLFFTDISKYIISEGETIILDK